MKTDKNTVIGFVLLGILFFIFFWYTNKQQQVVLAEQKRKEDSLARLKPKVQPVDSVAYVSDSLRNDSLGKASMAGEFVANVNAPEQMVTVENDLMKVHFSTKGGIVKGVELKKFRSVDSNLAMIAGGKNDGIYYDINTGNNKTASTENFSFTPSSVQSNPDGSQQISFTLAGDNGRSVTHTYLIKKDNYLIDWKISLAGANTLVSQNNLNMYWSITVHKHQHDSKYEKQQSRIAYVEGGDFDYHSAYEGASHTFEKPANWMSFKQQFFNSTLIAKTNFASGNLQLTAKPDSTKELYDGTANVKLPLQGSASNAGTDLQIYFGPTDYHILKKYDNQMENLVDLGSGVFSFVKYINRYIIFPVFNFFAGFISNYGWVILLLTLFIRIVTAPLTYSSYLSGAKMKVLRPEMDELRKKHGDDQQAFAMDQMKLYREAGVNPLGGCIPALLQIPIFFALYSFFNSNIDLRGVPFLWSKDLSQYDSILDLPFEVWFNFGSHISLFTITAVVTSFLISVYNMSMTPDTGNPAMKYMPYIFPFILLFIFNKLPSALTWYYTVSNIITLLLQFVIQTYIIDHDKILAKIEATRKKPKEKSKWAQRYEQMMESQKKMQELKDKNNQRNKK